MAQKLARRRIAKSVRPDLRLIKNDKSVAKSSRKRTLKAVALVGELSQELPLFQQEALIMKYRIKARKLGRSILRRWHSRMDLEEVDSVVDLSLCEAVKRFDPEKGASFMTFLFYHLKGNLVRAVTAAAAASSIPLAIADLTEMNAFDGEDRARAKNMGFNAIELAEAVTSQETMSPDEALWRKELNGKSALACEKLDDLEREIVRRIFVQEQQIIDIAAALGYSRCHISRVKKKALDTLHDELRVVINHDDYAAIEQKRADEMHEVELRIASRKEIHRRRPRSGAAQRDVDSSEAEAA